MTDTQMEGDCGHLQEEGISETLLEEGMCGNLEEPGTSGTSGLQEEGIWGHQGEGHQGEIVHGRPTMIDHDAARRGMKTLDHPKGADGETQRREVEVFQEGKKEVEVEVERMTGQGMQLLRPCLPSQKREWRN